ncbi:MAG: outer membrane lipoprotein-sorting protein [Gammaproteobacteria bacterium]|nr:outer membrane lipoprotein-sorting protein [Gammaproteobacteria bacterium]
MSHLWLLLLLLFSSVQAREGDPALWDGKRLMEEALQRQQQSPWVYEEQTLILTDRQGEQNVRKQRLYIRAEADGSLKYLLRFTYPPEVEGVTLRIYRDGLGGIERQLYLPALGQRMIPNPGVHSGDTFFGSDFSVFDLSDEQIDEFSYLRSEDPPAAGLLGAKLVVDAFPATPTNPHPLYRKRRHYIDAEMLTITRTDYYDHVGRLAKRRSRHDLRPVGREGETRWRADMVLMENLLLNHRSLLKVEKRIYSQNYVPAEIFEPKWILQQGEKLIPRRQLWQDLDLDLDVDLDPDLAPEPQSLLHPSATTLTANGGLL